MSARVVVRVLCLSVLLASAVACKEEGGVTVSSFKFNGTQAVSEGQLRSVLSTVASSKIPFGQKHYFSRQQFDADLKRIVAFYNDRGYPDARVTSFDAKLNKDQTAVDITVNIAEGEPLRVEQLTLVGFEPLPAEHRAALDAQMPLRTGQPLDRALLQANREAALDELKDHGYPYASVKLEVVSGTNDHARAVTLRAEPGPLTNFGPIEIVGNESVSENVVRRQLTYRPGRIFRQSALQDSQRKLYTAELFEFANVQPVKTEGQPLEIPTRVTIKEGKHQKVNFSFGYGSEERARTQVDWRQVNFFGGARTAGVLARYSSLDKGLRLSFKQPYFFSPRYELGVSAQSWWSDEPAFTLATNGGRITVTRQFRRGGGPVLGSRPATSLSLSYINENQEYTINEKYLNDPTLRDDFIALGLDPRCAPPQFCDFPIKGTRSAYAFDGGRNTTNNLLDASRGYVAAVHFEQAAKMLGGTYSYFETTTEGRYYRSFGRVVGAVQARLGSIQPHGDLEANVPFFKRYFLGGANNLRGWGRFDVAPTSGSGFPLGGASFFNFSTEVRVPVWGSIGGVLFLDGGNVWTDPWNFNLNDMRYDVGPGLRYNTKIGPIRADLGYQLNPIAGLQVNGKPEARQFRFHFSIGQAF
ncbi:MAG: BamA/TamA family outer membrane protein [Acidobacteriota bacterium]